MDGELVCARGQCHCGGVWWEADVPAKVEVHECNCSICERVGYQHLILPQDHFRLLGGSELLTEYGFNTGVAKHLFCSVCGVKGFYVPRSNPDGISLNLRCLDTSVFQDIRIVPFDGQNWEDHAGELAHLSKR